MSKWERAVKLARSQHPNATDADVHRVAKHLFARMISGGRTIGKKSGKLVIDGRVPQRPHLP